MLLRAQNSAATHCPAPLDGSSAKDALGSSEQLQGGNYLQKRGVHHKYYVYQPWAPGYEGAACKVGWSPLVTEGQHSADAGSVSKGTTSAWAEEEPRGGSAQCQMQPNAARVLYPRCSHACDAAAPQEQRSTPTEPLGTNPGK